MSHEHRCPHCGKIWKHKEPAPGFKTSPLIGCGKSYKLECAKCFTERIPF